MVRTLQALVVGLALIAASCGGPSSSVKEGHLVGERARDFSLKDSNGETVRLSDYEGKVVVLDFWATWCPPCRKEIPGFVALQSKYGDDDVVVIGVSLDDSWGKVRAFMGEYKINYPVVLDTRQEVPGLYGGLRGLPTTFVIDREGIIRTKHEGYGPPELFVKAVEEAL